MLITSSQNPTIKHLVKLRVDGKYRREKKELLVIGEKMVKEISKKLTPHLLILSNPSFQNITHSSILMTTDSIMKKITGIENHEGIAATFVLPEVEDVKRGNKFLVLDKIRDPGNLGTLIRTALAFNFDAIIITPESVDPFNEKALRAAKGATFFIPILHKTLEEISLIKAKAYVADLEGEKLEEINFEKPLLLILSSESKGVSSWSEKIAKKVTIPIKNIDSLNVAIAGAIIMQKIGEQSED